jgi:hypothetical protein
VTLRAPQLVATPRVNAAPNAALLLPAPPLAPLPRGAVPASRGVRCQVPGCTALEGVAVRRFTARARVCDTHAAASAVQLDGVLGMSRLCVRCAVFHTVDAFEASRRFCLASQETRNERRRDAYARYRSATARRAAAAAAAAAAPAPAAAEPSSSTPGGSASETLMECVDTEGGSGSKGHSSDADARERAQATPLTEGGSRSKGCDTDAEEERRVQAVLDTPASADAASDAFLFACNDDDLLLAEALGLTFDDAGALGETRDDSASAQNTLPPPPAWYARGLPPWQPQYTPPWAPQPVSLKFPRASPLELPGGFGDALQYALYGTTQRDSDATAAVLFEGWVAPGCTLLRCDVATLCGGEEEGAEAAPEDAVHAVARLLACAAVAHPDVAAFLAAQAPWSLAWRGTLAVVDADGGVSSAPRAPDAPPPLARLPPPRPLAAPVGSPLTVPLTSLAAAHARPQCRFHGRVLAGVRHAATLPPNAPAALHIAALPPTPGCALLEYAPADGDDAGPFPAPRPLVVCPNAAVADEINTLSPRRSDASEALLWALGTALRRDARCPLPLAALVTGVAIARGWAATTAALLVSLRESFDDVADAHGDEHARAVLEATLGRRNTLAARAQRTPDARILAAVLAAGGPEAAFGAPAGDGGGGVTDDDDAGDEQQQALGGPDALHAPAARAASAVPTPRATLPPELMAHAFRCYAFCAVFVMSGVRSTRTSVASLPLTPEMVAAVMPHLPPNYAAVIYHSRIEAAHPVTLLLCAIGMLLTRVRRLAPLYTRVHVPFMATFVIWMAMCVPVWGAVLAAREWNFGPDLAAGQLGVPQWHTARVFGWMVGFSAFAASTPLPPRLHGTLLLLRGLLPFVAHIPGCHNLFVHIKLGICAAHALVVIALAASKWRLAALQDAEAAAAAAAAAQAAATRKRL